MDSIYSAHYGDYAMGSQGIQIIGSSSIGSEGRWPNPISIYQPFFVLKIKVAALLFFISYDEIINQVYSVLSHLRRPFGDGDYVLPIILLVLLVMVYMVY